MTWYKSVNMIVMSSLVQPKWGAKGFFCLIIFSCLTISQAQFLDGVRRFDAAIKVERNSLASSDQVCCRLQSVSWRYFMFHQSHLNSSVNAFMSLPFSATCDGLAED